MSDLVKQLRVPLDPDDPNLWAADKERREAAARIEALEAALREANWLIGELAGHEGAEGWSEYLRKRLDAFDARAALAPEQDK
jgi:hypothetical protein